MVDEKLKLLENVNTRRDVSLKTKKSQEKVN